MAFSAMAQLPGPAINPSDAPSKDKFSYALGMSMAEQVKRAGLDVDTNVISQAISDVLEGRPTKVKEAEIRSIFMQARAAGFAKLAKKNKEAGEAYLAKNAKEQNIKTLPDGLQYRVIQEGTGEIPKNNDTVLVKYRGNLIDGTEFDHNDKFRTRVTAVIKGWTEALELMKAGSKWQIFVPSDLAYGDQGNRDIGPNAMLIFEMELISIEAPSIQPKASTSPSTPPNPIVSEQIVRVPSQDGLKHGEQIAVIQNGKTNVITNSVPPPATGK